MSAPTIVYCDRCEDGEAQHTCGCRDFVCAKCWDSIGCCKRCADGPSDAQLASYADGPSVQEQYESAWALKRSLR